MEQVIISGRQAGGSAAGNDNLPTENVSFIFGKIKWTYTQQKRTDGTGGGNVAGSFDLTANKINSQTAVVQRSWYVIDPLIGQAVGCL